MNTSIPPLVKWTGSKRHLASQILTAFPKEIDTFYEPFCGGCSITLALLNSNIKFNKIHCSDINQSLISLLDAVKTFPGKVILEYELRHNNLINSKNKIEFYNEVRARYNLNKCFHDFNFLTRTCTNGLIRYNSRGEFNSSFHHTRNGISIKNFKDVVLKWSDVFQINDVIFTMRDYLTICPNENDFVFLDPPYFNTKGMYTGNFNFSWQFLKSLKCKWAMTYDGKRSGKDLDHDVPKDVYSTHYYLPNSVSSFNKLKKDKIEVQESIYFNYIPVMGMARFFC